MACGLGLPFQEMGPGEPESKKRDLVREQTTGSEEGEEKKSRRWSAGTFFPPSSAEGWEHRLLSALAGISYGGEQTYFDSAQLLEKRRSLGQVYVVVESPESMTCPEFLHRWGDTGVTLLTRKAGESFGWPVLDLDRVRREAAK